MGIGACVLLLAGGAVLAFATDFSISGVDLDAVGVILMIAGALGLIVTIATSRPRTRSQPPVAQPAPAAPYAPQPADPYGNGQPPAGQYPPNPAYAPREYR